MSKVNWLLETDLFDENLGKLVDEIRKQGMICKIAGQESYVGGKTYLDLFDPDDCVVFYGSLGFSAQVTKESKWVPGSYYTRKNYYCSSYYPYYGEHLLNNR